MSSLDSFVDKLDSETRDVIDYLSNITNVLFLFKRIFCISSIFQGSRSEVCDLNIQRINGASSNQINEWEIVNIFFIF